MHSECSGHKLHLRKGPLERFCYAFVGRKQSVIKCGNPRPIKDKRLDGRPGTVVMGDDSCLKGCGFESWRCILDGHLDIFHINFSKNCIVCLERPKINEKEAGVGPFF